MRRQDHVKDIGPVDVYDAFEKPRMGVAEVKEDGVYFADIEHTTAVGISWKDLAKVLRDPEVVLRIRRASMK